MTTTLSNGVKVPDVGSNNWGSDLETNWQLLNACIGAVGSNVQTDRANTWTARQTFALPIYGDVVGTATMASSDASGNDIPTTYATKTELAAKAADSEVVHIAGAETITGDKTWTGQNTLTKEADPNSGATVNDCAQVHSAPRSLTFYNTRGSSNYKGFGTFLYCGYLTASAPRRYSVYEIYRSTDKRGDTNDGYEIDPSFVLFGVYPVYSTVELTRNVRTVNDGTNNALYPSANNSTDCGMSNAKWRSFNGANPGALSLPNESAVVDISGSITNLQGTANVVTQTVDGWFSVLIPVVAGDYIRAYVGNSTNSRYIMEGTAGDAYISLLIPASANTRVALLIKATGGAVQRARFYPCLGNV